MNAGERNRDKVLVICVTKPHVLGENVVIM